MQESPAIQITTEQEVQEVHSLKNLALQKLESMPKAEGLTQKQKEALAKDAVIDFYSKRQNPGEAEDVGLIISQRIADTLHGLTFEINKSRKCSTTRKGADNDEQLKSHEKLLNTIDVVKKNSELKQFVISHATGILEKTSAPDENFADICANFLHHSFTNKKYFTENHAAVIFEKIYLDEELTEYKKNIFNEAASIFSANSSALLEEFLQNPFVQKTDIQNAEQEDIFTKWEIVLIKHGNINARNRVLSRMQKFIEGHIRSYALRNNFRREHLLEDACQAVMEKVSEKLIMIDIKKASATTYLHYMLMHLIRRELYKMALINQPAYVHAKRESATKNNINDPDAPTKVTYVRINRMVGENKDIPVSDIIPALQTHETPETIFLEKDLSERVSSVLERLSPRDRELITMRANGVTMQVIADKWGVTRQNIDRIEKSLMKNLLNVRFRKFRADLD